MATIKDISKLAHVSPGTVSRALSPEKVSMLPSKRAIRSAKSQTNWATNIRWNPSNLKISLILC